MQLSYSPTRTGSGVHTRAPSDTVCAGMVDRHVFGRLETIPPLNVSRRLPYQYGFFCSPSSAWNSVSWLSGKSLELLRPDVFPMRKIGQKCVCSRGSAPDLLAGFKRRAERGKGRETVIPVLLFLTPSPGPHRINLGTNVPSQKIMGKIFYYPFSTSRKTVQQNDEGHDTFVNMPINIVKSNNSDGTKKFPFCTGRTYRQQGSS